MDGIIPAWLIDEIERQRRGDERRRELRIEAPMPDRRPIPPESQEEDGTTFIPLD